MALLEMGGSRFTVPVGDVVLGAEPSCTIVLAGERVLARHAVLQGMPDGQVVIRKAVPQAEVRINGVRLGAEPTPLLHGDKVEVGGHELTFVDERRSGSTQYIPAMKVSDRGAPGSGEAGVATSGPEGRVVQPTSATGGRVVCLTDGREYQVTGNSLVFGRDATSDVVVPGKDVSRRHCEIIQTPKGYLLVDSSTNGTFVNDQRMEGQRLLARADVIRIGDEQFRFYADRTATAPGPSAGAGAAGNEAVPAPTAPQAPSPSPSNSESASAAAKPSQPPSLKGGSEQLKKTVHGMPGVAPPASPASPASHAPVPPPAPRVLAAFLVKKGDLQGQRLAVRSPVVNIGRADYNDLVLPDASVSTSHAKLQRREGVWVLSDLDSSNGTFVDGERVRGETALAPGSAVRLGDVHLAFEPAEDEVAVAKGGGTQLIEKLEVPAAPPKPAQPPAPPSPSPARPSPRPASPSPPAPGRKSAPRSSPPSPKPRPGKRPAVQAPAAKKGKGCGAKAVILLAGMTALVYWILV
jgi:pSer/pThr/pTyr-binding forkhead associated (FHA) protein